VGLNSNVLDGFRRRSGGKSESRKQPAFFQFQTTPEDFIMPQQTFFTAEQPVTTAQLANHLQVTTRTLATYRAQRRIPFWKITARNFRYRISDVEAALSK
jgi:hypothetical protein